ncbi:MAG: hypothetical protein ACPGUC_04910 [Gammaproteobacteria bacterium]
MSPLLLTITEQGGYPDLTDRYEAMGLEVMKATHQRKALKLIKSASPDIVLAEFIYTPDFRDRIGNLDTLAGQLRVHHPHARLIVLYEPEDRASLDRFKAIHSVYAELPHPVAAEQLTDTVRAAIDATPPTD